MPKKMLVIGPSHVKRLEHAVNANILPELSLRVDFWGRDGMAVWHPLFLKQLSSVNYDHIFVIVGDFRFGNKTFAKTEAKNANGVEKDLINVDNDAKLYEKSLATIDQLIGVFGDKISFLFWDLLGREFANRRDNKYTADGRYRHPTWNYDDVSSRYPNHIIDVGFLKQVCMDRLTVDSANHFSMFAYLMITDAIQHYGNKRCFTREELEFKFQVLDQKFQQLPFENTYLVCDPPIYHRFNEALSKGALPNHSKLNLLTIQEFATQKQRSLDESAKVLYLSSFRRVEGHDNAAKYQLAINALDKIKLSPSRFTIVFFDYLCDYVFELRNKQINQPVNLPDPSDEYSLETLQSSHVNAIHYPLDNDGFLHSVFELSGRLPNFKGYFLLLMSASLGQTSAEFVNFSYNYFIRDVFAAAGIGLDVAHPAKPVILAGNARQEAVSLP